MLKKIIRGFALLLFLLLSAAGLKFILIGKDLKIDELAIFLTKSENTKGIRLTYLGCAGFIIEYNNSSILCDPYISNPSLYNFGNEHADWSKYVAEDKLNSIDLVTISHGHYDHCYDMESLSSFIQPNSKIVGDVSVQNQLNTIYTNRALQKTSLEFDKKQEWIYNTTKTFRVLPLPSIHSPHIANYEFFKGSYASPLSKPPVYFWDWKKGNAYSYLIDILEKDSIYYRIILTNGNLNSASVKMLKEMSAERTSDLQLQIFWKEEMVVKNMFTIYGITQPKQIILQHWNNFFRNNNKTLQYLRSSNLPKVLKRYNNEDIPVSFMLPFRDVTF
ncbi:MAG: MBL fold metallo-hydrolase [Sphingobacteriales bacterium]|nr:MBL fold metallo-hydrolase [Sphingobacteriales bacterium]